MLKVILEFLIYRLRVMLVRTLVKDSKEEIIYTKIYVKKVSF